VRIHPERPDSLLIEFFDPKGINLSKAREKKIEGAFFREDIRRARIHEIGNVTYYNQAFTIYGTTFERMLHFDPQQLGTDKVVIDYAYSVADAVLPRLLANLGYDAVVLNASLRQTVVSTDEREQLLSQLGHVVEALHARFGVQVAANGEQLVLVDETGVTIRGETLTGVMVSVMLTNHPRGAVVVPVHASGMVERIAHRHDSRIIRTKANPTALMEASRSDPSVVLGGSGDMGFIFPQLHPGFDAMFCIAKLMETLTLQRRSLEQIRLDLPRVCHRTQSVRCPWATKGALMRHLIETHSPAELDLTDGVKVVDRQGDRWVLVLPDASEPLVHLYANGDDRDWVDTTLRHYRTRVQNFVSQELGIQE
jgi:mannose-1-phosphate guanylyltransferase/phosphomannomutase